MTLGTDASGDATFGVAFATSDLTGNFITATATDPYGNTSEFSNCVIVNPGAIIVEKQTDPSGSPQSFNFSLTDGPSNLNQSFTLSDGDTHDSGPILPGFGYSVTETVPSGWDLISATCDDGSPVDNINVSPKETVTCIFTNTLPNVETATGTGIVTFESGKGTIEDLAAVAEGTLPAEGKPDLDFPHGFFSFNITGLPVCQNTTVVVTITLPSAVPVGTEYWKYHASEGGWIQIPMGSNDGDNVITITLVDGGLGDDDGVCDGVIVDQGGPGQQPTKPVGGIVVPVNRLGLLAPWMGLAALASLAALMVALARRRRS